jgi:uncharacterized protein YndB with AHSA1/START domain
MKNDLSVEIQVAAPVTTTWDMLLNVEGWWPGASLERRVGGAFTELWYEDGALKKTVGKVLQMEPYTLSFFWKDIDWPGETRVTFTLRAYEGQTRVQLSHVGWSIFPAQKAQELIGQHKQGWQYHLADLKEAIEKRVDS